MSDECDNSKLKDPKSLIYKASADWVQMVNSVTWTVASLYLLASMVALATTLQSGEFSLMRLVMPIVWIVLCIFWYAIDNVYETSAILARRTLVEVEKEFPEGPRPYTDQDPKGRQTITSVLKATAVVIWLTWILVLFIRVDSYVHPDTSLFKYIQGSEQPVQPCCKIADLPKPAGDACCKPTAQLLPPSATDIKNTNTTGDSTSTSSTGNQTVTLNVTLSPSGVRSSLRCSNNRTRPRSSPKPACTKQ